MNFSLNPIQFSGVTVVKWANEPEENHATSEAYYESVEKREAMLPLFMDKVDEEIDRIKEGRDNYKISAIQLDKSAITPDDVIVILDGKDVDEYAIKVFETAQKLRAYALPYLSQPGFESGGKGQMGNKDLGELKEIVDSSNAVVHNWASQPTEFKFDEELAKSFAERIALQQVIEHAGQNVKNLSVTV